MGITMLTALILAEECGVTNDEIRQAVVRGENFFSYFIERGTIPYGDHGAANHWFDDNGKSGSAAIMFDLLGNQEGARFFADMVLGSAPSGREAGHTGCYWSHLWGGIGAARGGEYGLQAFSDEMEWAFTLERGPDGRFVFQGNAGEGDKKNPQGAAKTKWDCTGARLLQLCVPRRKLFLTGKNTPRDTHLTDKRLNKIFAAGALYVNPEARLKLEMPHILALLKDPLPTVRYTGVQALKEQKRECVDELLALLDSKDRFARYGAAEALGVAGRGNQAAADKLIQVLSESDDITLQTYAIRALTGRDKNLGLLTAAKPAIPILLKMAVQDRSDDPRGVLQFAIAEALFYRGSVQPVRALLVEYGLEGVDRDLLIPAMEKILTNENGRGRSFLNWVYKELNDEELDRLWDDIYKSTRDLAPSGIMFASGIRQAGLKTLAEKRIKEGLPLAAWYVRYQKMHGSAKRVPDALNAILKYEGHAKSVIPQLEQHAEWYEAKRNKRKPPADTDPDALIRAAIEKIKAMGDPDFELISIEDHLKGQQIIK